MNETLEKWLADRFYVGTDGLEKSTDKPVNPGNIGNQREFARELGYLLYQWQKLPIIESLKPNFENRFAGNNLEFFEPELLTLLDQYKNLVPADLLQENLERAAKKKWSKEFVWVHGNLVPQNLRVRDGKLVNVIGADKAVSGDPACDLAIAWLLFDQKARKIFFNAAEADEATINRARFFALRWALKNYHSQDIDELIQSRDATTEILKDFNYTAAQDMY